MAQPLYVFYGQGISYFFVDELPTEELPNPTDDFSVLGNKSQKSHNPLDPSRGSFKNQGESLSMISRTNSVLFKASKPTIFSDKAMQLKHRNLNIRQIILGEISGEVLTALRENSSVKISWGRKTGVQLSSAKLGFAQHNQGLHKKFSKVLVLLEKNKCKAVV